MTDEPRRIEVPADIPALRDALAGRIEIDEYDEPTEEDIAEQRAFAAAAITDERLRRWVRDCPQRFHRAVLDDVEAVARGQIDSWMRIAPRPNLLLSGPVGTGKTHAALAAARHEWVEHGLGVRFYPVPLLLDLLRPGARDADSTVSMPDLIEIERLVLDDVGTERQTEWSHERLDVLIDARWFEERPIIATTNLSLTDLREAVGARTYSRLVGNDAVVIAFGGADRRLGR